MAGFLIFERSGAASGEYYGKRAGIEGVPSVTTQDGVGIIAIDGVEVDPGTATWGPLAVPADERWENGNTRTWIQHIDGSDTEKVSTNRRFVCSDLLMKMGVKFTPEDVATYDRNTVLAATILACLQEQNA